MFGITALRRSNKAIAQRRLSLPPGFRAVFLSEDSSGSAINTLRDDVALKPVQVNDTGSSEFGDFLFLVGYDTL